VSLNTNYCSDDSWWLLVGDNSVDPEGQLEWFVKVMQKVMCFMHFANFFYETGFSYHTKLRTHM